MTKERAGRGEEVRRRLLVAAASLIPEVGWGSVTTRLVAERAAVAPGLVHYHFASVADLLRRAALAAVDDALAAAALPAGAGPEGLAVLLAALDDHDGADPAALLLAEAHLAAARDPELRAGLAERLHRFRADLAGWLSDGGAPDAPAVAAVLAAAVDGVLLHRSLDPALTAPAVSAVLRRLLPDPAPGWGAGPGGGR